MMRSAAKEIHCKAAKLNSKEEVWGLLYFFQVPLCVNLCKVQAWCFLISYYIFDWYWNIYSCLRGHACGAKDPPQGHKFELHQKSPRDFPITSYAQQEWYFVLILLLGWKSPRDFPVTSHTQQARYFCFYLITRMKKSHQSASYLYPYYATGVIFSPYLITWMKPLSYFVSIYAIGMMLLLKKLMKVQGVLFISFTSMFSTHLW